MNKNEVSQLDIDKIITLEESFIRKSNYTGVFDSAKRTGSHIYHAVDSELVRK